MFHGFWSGYIYIHIYIYTYKYIYNTIITRLYYIYILLYVYTCHVFHCTSLMTLWSHACSGQTLAVCGLILCNFNSTPFSSSSLRRLQSGVKPCHVIIYVHNIIYTLYIYRGCLVMKMAPISWPFWWGQWWFQHVLALNIWGNVQAREEMLQML